MKLAIGENIRNFRKKNDLTQEALADRLGVAYQSVSRWENGATYPDLELIPAIAEVLAVTVDELLGMPQLEKEKRAAEAFDELRRECIKRNYYADKIVELLRDIRRNYLNSDSAWRPWVEGNDRAFRDPKILPEVRLLAEAYLERHPTNDFLERNGSPQRIDHRSNAERGERLTTNIPYGYKRNPDDPKAWIVDEGAAQVVKRIFALCMEGKGPSQIAALLEKEMVLNPTAYKHREGRKTPHQTPENEYRWHENTVAYILEYMEYTGCTVNFKTYTNSIYDKKQRENPMENRRIFYNTHPAIISLEVFDKVQEIRQQRHRRTATGKSNMFSGLVFCNDCKQKLYYSTTSYFERRQDFFICSTHRVNKDKRSGHYIRTVVLEQLVWKHIQEVISVVTRYEAYFRSEMEQ